MNANLNYVVQKDDKIKLILEIIYYCGKHVHKRIFKKFITRYKVNGKNIMSMDTLNRKLKLMSLIDLVVIKQDSISLTTQGISYSANKIVRARQLSIQIEQLKYNTQARIRAYINKSNYEEILSNNVLLSKGIYKYDDNGFVIGKRVRESKNAFLGRIKYIMYNEIKDFSKPLIIYIDRTNFEAYNKYLKTHDLGIEIKYRPIV